MSGFPLGMRATGCWLVALTIGSQAPLPQEVAARELAPATERWRWEPPGPSPDRLIGPDGGETRLFVSDRSMVYALDAATGALLWKTEPSVGGRHHRLFALGDHALVIDDQGHAWRLDPAGHAEAAGRLAALTDRLLHRDPYLVAVSSRDRSGGQPSYVLDLYTVPGAKRRWRRAMGSDDRFAGCLQLVPEAEILVTGTAGEVLALPLVRGKKPVWSFVQDSPRAERTLLVFARPSQGELVAYTDSARVTLELRTGKPKRVSALPAPLTRVLARRGSMATFLAGGSVAAIDLETGMTRWMHRPTEPLTGEAVIAGDVLWVRDYARRLVGIALGDGEPRCLNKDLVPSDSSMTAVGESAIIRATARGLVVALGCGGP